VKIASTGCCWRFELELFAIKVQPQRYFVVPAREIRKFRRDLLKRVLKGTNRLSEDCINAL
jgi:hypothetical protein